MTNNNAELPLIVDDTFELPSAYRSLYEFRSDDRYHLSSGGRQLKNVKTQIREGVDYRPPAKPKQVPVVSKQDWLTTTSAANPKERKALLQAAARGEIKVTG